MDGHSDWATIPLAQAPALRAFVVDPVNMRSIEFIWEDGEQAVSDRQFVGGAGNLEGTYTGDFFGSSANRVHAWTTGLGRGLFDSNGVLIPGSNAAQPIGNLVYTLDSPDAFVFSFGVGVGSSVGDFQGFADRITIGFDGQTPTTFNFTTQQDEVAPIPEPTTLVLFGVMATAAGFAARRRRTRSGVTTD